MSKENPHLYSDVRNICPHCQKVQSNTEICFFCHREMLPSKDEQIATWKSRAEKLKDEYDIENGIRRAIQSHAEKLEAERDSLKSLCEKLKGYARHEHECYMDRYKFGPNHKCTCGLNELLKQTL